MDLGRFNFRESLRSRVRWDTQNRVTPAPWYRTTGCWHRQSHRLGHLEQQRLDLLEPARAQGRRGPGDIGMIPNLGIGVGLAANEHPCHHILRHIRFHLARGVGVTSHPQPNGAPKPTPHAKPGRAAVCVLPPRYR